MNNQFNLSELNDIYYALGVTHQNQVNGWIRAKHAEGDKELAEFYSQQMALYDTLMKKVDKMVEEEYKNTIAGEDSQDECEYLTIPSEEK